MIRSDDVRVGTEISCTISGKKVKRAKLQLYNGYIYVCQNIQSGDPCDDKLGYDYSWSVGPIPERGQDLELFFGATDVRNVEYYIYPDWDAEANR